ncbi:ATP-binding protein [Halorhodospira halophila]|uniref:histidine kinase n=1 Tax=Halorhodospira halophila (strain DSM 244 / SL1) TaxID=349124 RepID=A1WXJ5_HALHL|nr:ATP-binding protein [Halorhodospira halophila]ABM62407.1 PAS/PAC sensor hybrid histidine kinase [Halorhodospira halophila SL1]MBK1729537.1 hypothetical protein [Halorhodospira halophila]
MVTEQQTLLEVARATTAIGGWMLDRSTQAVHLSTETRRLLELPPEHRMDLRTGLGLYPPEYRPIVTRAIHTTLHHARPFQLDVDIHTATGKRLHVRKLGKPLMDDYGNVLGLRGALQDLTEIKTAERQARRLSQRLETTLESITDAFFLVDPAWRFTFLNREAERQLNCQREDVLGRVAWEVFPEALGTAFEEHYRYALAQQEPVVFEAYFAPVETWFEARAYPSDEGLAVYFRDISQRKQAEAEMAQLNEELHQARERAEQASRAKSEFLAAMSHELRTPLNAITGFAQLLHQTPPDETQDRDQHLEQILSAGWHLRDLIGDVIDFAQIETGQLAVHAEPMAIDALARNSVAMITEQARRRGLTVHCQSDPIAPPWARADPVRSRQVLLNLLSNAVKYNNPHGTITVTWSTAGGSVQVDVADTGSGIPHGRRDRLFEPFERLGREAGSIEGSGIGLSLSQRLARMMSGDLQLLHSSPDRGTTMRLTLPRYSDDHSATSTPPVSLSEAAPAAPMRICYIEDNELNMMVVRGLIRRKTTVTLDEAWTGAEGLARIRQGPPDLVLLDMHLPDMHGRQVLREIRADPVLTHLPVVALSADAANETLETADGTLDGYLLKPFRLADLDALIARFAPA